MHSAGRRRAEDSAKTSLADRCHLTDLAPVAVTLCGRKTGVPPLMLGSRIHLTSNLVSVSESGGRSFVRAAIDCDGWSARRKLTVNGWSAISAPGSLCAEAGQGLPLFPAPLCPLAACFLRCAPDRFLLTKPNTFLTIELPASLRSDGVRDHPGMSFGFPSEERSASPESPLEAKFRDSP